jgi:multiple RNA-binding domain-containing protein 1
MLRSEDEVEQEDDDEEDEAEGEQFDAATAAAAAAEGGQTAAAAAGGAAEAEVLETGRLFVRNLAYSAGEAELSQLFGGFGDLEGVHLVLDRWALRYCRF